MDECENLVINLEDVVEKYEELADKILQQEEIINDNDAEVIQLTQALTEGDIMVNHTLSW